MPPTDRVFLIHPERHFLVGWFISLRRSLSFSFRSMLVLPGGKTNDTAVFYFSAAELYRITGAGGPCGKITIRSTLRFRNKISMTLALMMTLVMFPMLAHYLSSYHPARTLTIAAYEDEHHYPVWDIRYVNVLILLWSALLCYMISDTPRRPGSGTVLLWFAFPPSFTIFPLTA